MYKIFTTVSFLLFMNLTFLKAAAKEKSVAEVKDKLDELRARIRELIGREASGNNEIKESVNLTIEIHAGNLFIDIEINIKDLNKFRKNLRNKIKEFLIEKGFLESPKQVEENMEEEVNDNELNPTEKYEPENEDEKDDLKLTIKDLKGVEDVQYKEEDKIEV